MAFEMHWRPQLPKRTRRDEIFEVLVEYAKDHGGNSPSQGDLLHELRRRGYAMCKGTLQVHLLKLLAEDRLYRKDGKLVVRDAVWIPPDETEFLSVHPV